MRPWEIIGQKRLDRVDRQRSTITPVSDPNLPFKGYLDWLRERVAHEPRRTFNCQSGLGDPISAFLEDRFPGTAWAVGRKTYIRIDRADPAEERNVRMLPAWAVAHVHEISKYPHRMTPKEIRASLHEQVGI